MTDRVAERYAGRTVLMTGAGGYLGGSLAHALAGIGCRVVPIRWGDGDLTDPAAWRSVLTAETPDVVFHLGSQTSVYAAAKDPVADQRANVLPMLGLLEATRASGGRPVIVFTGAATQTGVTESLHVPEDRPDDPRTFYDLHKLIAEWYLRQYCREGWARGVTLRLTNVYGPGPASNSPDRGVLNRIVGDALEGKRIEIYGDGSQVRDYVFVDDVVSALLAAGLIEETADGRAFVVGSGEACTLKDAFCLAARRVQAATGVEVAVAHVDWPTDASPIEFRSFVADTRAFEAATGWRPRVGLAEGIDRIIDALRAGSRG